MSTLLEEWVGVIGYDGLYEISRLGSVRSLRTGRLMTPTVGRHGYMLVRLSGAQGAKTFTVHRLVLEAYVGLRPHGMQARHLDGDRTNNNIVNLRWGSPTENANDKITHGTFAVGEQTNCAKLTSSDVMKIRKDLNTKTGSSLARRYGVDPTCISQIKLRKTWRHI